MKRSRLIQPVLVMALAGSTLLGGCVVHGSVGVEVPHVYVGVVATPPPPPQVEVYGAPPQPGYVWIGGYWNWYNGRHVWVPGRWEAGRPGYHWVAHTWVHEGGGWRLHEGHWAR